MKFVRFQDIRKYADKCMDSLMVNEAVNNLMIGIIERGIRTNAYEEWLMGTVEDENGQVRLTSLMTPPNNLLLSVNEAETANEAISVLLDYFEKNEIEIPGLLCEKELSGVFAGIYEQRFGGKFSVTMEERVYKLEKVEDIEIKGVIRKVNEKDMHYLPYWLGGFMTDALSMPYAPLEESAKAHIENGTLYVLEADGMPVCIAGTARKTPNGRSIGPVYTPPYYRRKGYASSCVALLSRKLLDEGNKFVALFTDLSNPASNGAYMKVGYQPISDYTQLKYEK